MAYRGDRVGCRVLFDEQNGSNVPVCFTLNGRKVGRTTVEFGSGPLYPCIGMGFEEICAIFTVSMKEFYSFKV